MSLAPDRDLFRNASDVAAALGISPYEKRAELLHRIKYGLEKDWSEWQQKMLLDKGNGIEALARPIAEALLGHPLPPRRFTSGKLGATLDGYHCDDALNSVNWECKTLNDAIRAAFNDTFEVEPGIKHNVRLPEYLCAQMEQQLMCSDADRCLFTAHKDGETVHCWYYPDAKMLGRIIEGWVNFERDLAAMPELIPVRAIEGQLMPVVRAFPAFPEVRFGIVGGSLADVLRFESQGREFVSTINQNLVTDQDFATGKNDETELANCVKMLDTLIDSPHDLAALKRVRDLFNKARISLTNQLSAQKQAAKTELVQSARKAYETHVISLRLEPYISVHMDFSPAVKGLSSIASMQNSLTAALLKAQSEATTLAAKVRANLAMIAAANNDLLFPNLGDLVKKEAADVANHISVTLAKAAAKSSADAEELERKKAVLSVEREKIADVPESNQCSGLCEPDCAGLPTAKINSLDDFLRSIGCDARYQMTNTEIKKTIAWLTEKLGG